MAQGGNVSKSRSVVPPSRSKRPRICPECDYNLEGSIAGGVRRCPECGTAFDPFKLPRRPMPGEWTEWVGLRRAAVWLILRSLICLPVWAATAWGAIWGLRYLPAAISTMAVAALILSVPGVVIGHFLSKDLTERAGMTSLIITIGTSIVAGVVIIAGVRIAQVFNPITGWQEQILWLATSLFAILWIIRNTVFDAD